jgi:acetyl esterase
VLGDLESHDRACRRLAARADVAVLAVDFRRAAPEHPWPAAVDDAVDVLRWAMAGAPGPAGPGTGACGRLASGTGTSGTGASGTGASGLGASGLGASRRAEPAIAVAGDSSGGNLAALACLRLRDDGGPRPAAQILVTPNTDLTLSQPTVREKGTGWGLEADDVAWGAELWIPGPAWLDDPRVSPLYAADLARPPDRVTPDPARPDLLRRPRRLAEGRSPARSPAP